MILRRIDPMSLAKVQAVVYGILLFALAVPSACFGAMVGSLGSEYGGDAFGAGFGLALIIVYPILGVIFGFIGGLLTAWIYNLVADRIGGVQLEFDQDYLDDRV